MRGFAGRHRDHRHTHVAKEMSRRPGRRYALALTLAGMMCLALAACGSASAPKLNLPGGTYSSATYDFHITYPRNWLANPSEATPASDGSVLPIPFTLIITRTGDAHSAASLISTCTVTVMNLKNSDIAKSAAGLATNKFLQTMSIGGVSGYASAPLAQDIPNSEISVTHTDYYVVHGGFEYQISTDSVKGDNADGDLRSIVESFSFGA